MIGAIKISEATFYKNGGFANPNHFRKMKSGVWTYWILT